MTDSEMDDGDRCANCDDPFGYEIGWDDPPKGEGHIEVEWNPADEPDFVVGEIRHYCSPDCLIQDLNEIPFDPPNGRNSNDQDTGSEREADNGE